MSSGVRGDRTVVITGIGMVTPLGRDRESTWRSILAGKQAGRALIPSEMGPAWIGMSPSADWRGCPIPRDWDHVTEPLIDDILVSMREAVAHASLNLRDQWRTGCVIGTSKGGMHRVIPEMSRQLRGQGQHEDRPIPDFPWCWPSTPAQMVAAELGIHGPALAPAAACATGLVSLIRAADLIRDGICEVVLAGSGDASLQPALLASYRRLGVMARKDDPATAGRPFDVSRQGFLVGEGAAVLVLEDLEHAERRGAKPLAEIVTGRVLSDGAGVTGLDETADGLTRAIEESLVAAKTSPQEIDLVSFHGTGTTQNDRSETIAWNRASRGTPTRAHGCAFKGGLGHLMGGAGSVETALSILAIRDQLAPPTANLLTIDPDLDRLLRLPWSFETPEPRPVRNVLKLSLGFGGPVAALVLRQIS